MEKVVNALKKPIITKSRISLENKFFSTRSTKAIPIKKLPIAFIDSVKNGNFPGARSTELATKYLITDPIAPPKAITRMFVIKYVLAALSS